MTVLHIGVQNIVANTLKISGYQLSSKQVQYLGYAGKHAVVYDRQEDNDEVVNIQQSTKISGCGQIA